MSAPAAYDYELEQGTADPLPWWVDYFWAGDRMNCHPWDFEPDVPRRFWMRCGLILASAENEARQIADEHRHLLHGGRS